MPVLDVVGGRAKASSEHPEEKKSSGDPLAEETEEFLMSTKVQNWAKRIQDLKKQQDQVKGLRKKLSKDLKAAQRKTRRLKERARHLSEDDMMAILMMKRKIFKADPEANPESPTDLTEGGQSSGSGAASTKADDFAGGNGDNLGD